jgi:hypothetical protein
MTECKYFVYGIRVAKGYATEMSYTSTVIQGSGSVVPAPTNLSATSNVRGRTDVRWTRSPDPTITGYAVYVVDENGRDSLYALVYGAEEVATLQIDNQANKEIYVYAFNANGIRSCKTEVSSIVTGVDNESDNRLPSADEPVVIVPNPVSSVATIRFNNGSDNFSMVEIVSITGSPVAQLLPTQISRNVSEVVWNTRSVAEGMYIVRVHTAKGIIVSKAMVYR